MFGLVLAGGKSERMGRDKGLLRYRDKPHRFWLADLLARHCERAFISVNDAQESVDAERYAYIVDDASFANNGPIGALMTANALHPNRAWLVLSCDLPYFDERAIRALLSQRDASTFATAFVNPDDDKPEPLVTIYEPAFMTRLPDAFAAGEKSLRRLLTRDSAKLVREFDRRWIFSANTPETYQRALNELAARGTDDPTA